MKVLKYVKAIVLLIGLCFIFSILITLFHYFDLFTSKTIANLKLLSMIISLFAAGIYIGKHSNKKGYLEGIKVGSIFIALLFLFTILTKNFTIKSIIYYAILLLSSTVGAMIGIQKKKE